VIGVAGTIVRVGMVGEVRHAVHRKAVEEDDP
jgi:hypothetical protein